MIEKAIELELAFEENQIVLGAEIMRVWLRNGGELSYFMRIAKCDRPGVAHVKELMRFCKDFPTELSQAIQASIQSPNISLLSTEERFRIRNSASDSIEARVSSATASRGDD